MSDYTITNKKDSTGQPAQRIDRAAPTPLFNNRPNKSPLPNPSPAGGEVKKIDPLPTKKIVPVNTIEIDH